MNVDQEQGQAPGKPAHRDLMASLVLFVIGGVALSQMGARLEDWVFPRVLAYALLGIGAMLVARVAAMALREGGLGRLAFPPEARQRALDVGVFCLIALAYVGLEDGAGFWITAFLMLVGASLYLSARRSLRTVLTSVATAALVCAIAYVVFLHLFYVPLPSGNWW